MYRLLLDNPGLATEAERGHYQSDLLPYHVSDVDVDDARYQRSRSGAVAGARADRSRRVGVFADYYRYGDDGGGKEGRSRGYYGRRGCEYRLSVPRFFLFVVSLPLGAFVFCVAWSLLFNFRESTSTHCRVPNYLPSISAAIGSFWPQHVVWRAAIAAHFPGRVMAITYYWQWYTKTLRPAFVPWSWIACGLHIIENVALVGLSFFNSTRFFPIHRNFFCTFIICSELYMFGSLLLIRWGRRVRHLDKSERRALRWKHVLAFVNCVSCVLCAYYYNRHNTTCEPFMYTWFCFYEYIIVLTNMAFHIIACMDFHDKSVSVPVPFRGIRLISRQAN